MKTATTTDGTQPMFPNPFGVPQNSNAISNGARTGQRAVTSQRPALWTLLPRA
jgi:hypothetical protein